MANETGDMKITGNFRKLIECLCNLAAMVKAYVKAIHGAKSQYFKNINALSFKRTFR